MSHLIVFSHLRWNFVYQRPQHLLSRLAPHYPVLFVEEPVYDAGPARFECSQPAPHVEVLRPHTPIEAAGFHDDQLSVLKPLLTEHLRARLIDDYLAWFYTPMALPLLAQLQPRAVVYDCMDELAAFRHAPRQMQQREAALLQRAQLVLTGGPSLYEVKRRHHDHVLCLPSAVDAAHYAPPQARADAGAMAEAERLQGDLGRPRLGYMGVVDERIDLGLLAQLADAGHGWQIVMVGPVVKIDPQSLPQRPNIRWLGQQPYRLLPQLVAGWDLCLLPFALNESTRYISPTKTLEYMAAEKPIVGTAVTDVISMYGDVVRIGRDAAGFVEACRAALAESDFNRAERIGHMLATVSHFSWDKAARTVQEAIEPMLALRPLAGAVLPPAAPLTSMATVNAVGSVASAAPPGSVALAASPGGAPTASAHANAAGARSGLRHWPHIIVGAGPTGLSAAYHLGLGADSADTLLVERESTVGGWCRSVQDHGFTFDHAGHIMFSTDRHVLDLYERLLGSNLHWQNREAWIWSHGVHTRYPFQGALYGLPPKVLKECLVGAIEARFGSLQEDCAKPAAPPANFEEFIERVWGRGIARHFALPYNRKLWAVPLAEMETSWLGGRVPLPDLEQMIEGALEPAPAPMGPNARFGYPLRGGFQALMDAFLPHLKAELALDTAVVHIAPAARTVRLDDGRSLRYDTLISTMPLPQLVAACGAEAPPEVRAAAGALRHVSVRCVNLGVAREHLTDKHWIYYPEDTVFHRIFVQGNASPHNNPPGGFGLTCEITYAPGKPLPCDGEQLVERVVADCRKVGLLRGDDTLITANQVDMPCAYVVYDHARSANVERIREWLRPYGIVLAGRYSEWEYYNSDHAFSAGQRAAERALAGALPRVARER